MELKGYHIKSIICGLVEIWIVKVVKIHAARRVGGRIKMDVLVFKNPFKLPLGKRCIQVETLHQEYGREKEKQDGEHFCEKVADQLLQLWKKISSTQGNGGRHSRVSQALSPDSGCGVSEFMSHLSTSLF